MKTMVKGRWVVGFEGDSHIIIEDGQLVYEDDEILFVGSHYDAPVDRVIDASDQLVGPGFVNYHSVTNMDVQILRIDAEEPGFPRGRSDQPHPGYIFDEEHTRSAAAHAFLTMLKTGSTTFGAITTGLTKQFEDPTYEPEIMLQMAGDMGIRGYFAHHFWARGIDVREDPPRRVWDEERGFRGLERAVDFINRHHGSYGGRIGTYLFPYTADSCTPDLLREAARRARDLGVTIRTHFAQSPREVQDIHERSGLSPVEYLDSVDFLSSNTTVTHALHIAGHMDTPYPDGRELDTLAARGTSVCHCPLVFARSGVILNSFSRYRAHGVNLAIGTDTFPQDIIQEMRLASYLGKVADRDRDSASAAEIYDAATLGGARAFNRSDIGRLTPGAKADIITIAFDSPDTALVDDPIKAVVNYSLGRDVRNVIVDGEVLVRDGDVRCVDEEQIVAQARNTYLHMTDFLVAMDPQGREREELFPFSYSFRRPD